MAPVSLKSDLETARRDARLYRKTTVLSVLAALFFSVFVPFAWSLGLDWPFPTIGAGLALGVAACAGLLRWGRERAIAGLKDEAQRRHAERVREEMLQQRERQERVAVRGGVRAPRGVERGPRTSRQQRRRQKRAALQLEAGEQGREGERV